MSVQMTRKGIETMRSAGLSARLLRLPVLLVVLALIAVGAAPEPAAFAAAVPLPSTGMVCTTNASATFTLTTRTGYITLPDGNTVFMWGFSEGNAPFQHPSPTLCVTQGQTVTVVVHNTLSEPVSIAFPGQVGVMANGSPALPEASGGVVTSLTNAAAPGGSITYSFIANEPGTYIYESGTEPMKQVQMGLFGALVVRPSLGAGYAYNATSTQFNPTTEYLILMSEVDPTLHQAVEMGQPYDMRLYQPRYWLINGRSFPDTIAPNGAPYLPAQPYGALAHIQEYDAIASPLPMLVRYANVGTELVAFHPHGNHGRMIARDGRPLLGPAAEDLSYEKFTVPVGPGQTWDATFDWRDAENYDPVTNPIPVVLPQLQNLVYGTLFSGSPYLGDAGQLPVGTQVLNQCGEYYHIAHNHALQQTTAWGVVMSGQITATRIDPVGGCQP
ncbi:MAG: multicopper oxidase domain-containing protein [Anaerolineae bacterium]